MSKERFDRNKNYSNIEEIAERVFARKTKNMTKEELAKYKNNVRMRFIAAAYYNGGEKTIAALEKMFKTNSDSEAEINKGRIK